MRHCTWNKFNLEMFLSPYLVRDLSIDLLNIVDSCQDELWMLCARCSASSSIIDKVYSMVRNFWIFITLPLRDLLSPIL